MVFRQGTSECLWGRNSGVAEGTEGLRRTAHGKLRSYVRFIAIKSQLGDGAQQFYGVRGDTDNVGGVLK